MAAINGDREALLPGSDHSWISVTHVRTTDMASGSSAFETNFLTTTERKETTREPPPLLTYTEVMSQHGASWSGRNTASQGCGGPDKGVTQLAAPAETLTQARPAGTNTAVHTEQPRSELTLNPLTYAQPTRCEPFQVVDPPVQRVVLVSSRSNIPVTEQPQPPTGCFWTRRMSEEKPVTTALIVITAISAFLSIFCCLCTGLPAFITALQAQGSKGEGRHLESRQKLYCSMGLIIASLFIAAPSIILIILNH